VLSATWRSSGLDPLPGHRRAPPPVVESFTRRLAAQYALPPSAITADHDDLQAVVAAPAGAALLGGPGEARAHGVPAWTAGGVRVEGLIWDSAPAGGTAPSDPMFEAARDGQNPLMPDERIDGDDVLARGVLLFRGLAASANAGDALGVSYKRFAELLFGAPFEQITGRTYEPSDSAWVIRLASLVTVAAGGRIPVRRGPVEIQAGMDTFIWPQSPPHDRSSRAWEVDWSPIPYSREEWRSVFPDGRRRLIP
jgi:hypothetical protein